MANEFGDEEIQGVVANEFGDIAVDEQVIVPRGTTRFTGFTPEQQVLANQFIRSEQRPTLSKVVEGAIGLGNALVQPVISIGRGFGAIPEIAAEPSRLIPTGAEAGRRVGMDIVNLAGALTGTDPLNPQVPPPSLLGGIKAGIPGLGVVEAIRQGLAGLAPRTPSEAEVLQFVEQAPFGEALAQERQKVAFEGAQPELAEAVTQAVELAPPLKGAQLLKGGLNVAKAPISRLAREAVKVSNPKIAASFEKAAASEMDEIFTRNPNADTIGATPMEGWATEVKGAFSETGERLSALRSQSGATLNAGDQLAKKIEARADALEAAGQPKSLIDEMNMRAADIRGRLTNVNNLQDAVTIANRKPNILKPKTTGEGFVDEIIARDGGDLINQELKAIAGPEGEAIRKKWSNLKLLNENVEARVNKIINNAPPEAQPALLQALSSPEGAAGVFALVNGWTLPGAVVLGTKIFQKWAKNEAKALKDSNSIVTGMYERLRANPPTVAPTSAIPAPSAVAPVAIPPPLPPQQTVQQAIAQAAGIPAQGVFPARPTQLPTVLPRSLPPDQLYQEMLRAIERGDIFRAQQISDQLKGL